MQRLHKFLRLRSFERSLVIEAAFLLFAYVLVVRLLPFRVWRRVLPDRGQAAAVPGRALSPEKVCWAVAAAARLIPGTWCLPQALAAHRLLRAAGYSARLRIGVCRTPVFRAHAWVESSGRVIVGGPAGSYIPLPFQEVVP